MKNSAAQIRTTFSYSNQIEHTVLFQETKRTLRILGPISLIVAQNISKDEIYDACKD